MFNNVSLEEAVNEISRHFVTIDDYFLLTNKYLDSYSVIASEERCFQFHMHCVRKILRGSVDDEMMVYHYNEVNSIDQAVTKLIESILFIRTGMNKFFYQICYWIPLITNIMANLWAAVIYFELVKNFDKGIFLIWTILQSKDFKSLEKFRYKLVYDDSNDCMLADDEIEEENLDRIEIDNKYQEKQEKESNFFYITLLVIISAMFVLALYSYVY